MLTKSFSFSCQLWCLLQYIPLHNLHTRGHIFIVNIITFGKSYAKRWSLLDIITNITPIIQFWFCCEYYGPSPTVWIIVIEHLFGLGCEYELIIGITLFVQVNQSEAIFVNFQPTLIVNPLASKNCNLELCVVWYPNVFNNTIVQYRILILSGGHV